MTEVQYSSVCD